MHDGVVRIVLAGGLVATRSHDGAVAAAGCRRFRSAGRPRIRRPSSASPSDSVSVVVAPSSCAAGACGSVSASPVASGAGGGLFGARPHPARRCQPPGRGRGVHDACGGCGTSRRHPRHRRNRRRVARRSTRSGGAAVGRRLRVRAADRFRYDSRVRSALVRRFVRLLIGRPTLGTRTPPAAAGRSGPGRNRRLFVGRTAARCLAAGGRNSGLMASGGVHRYVWWRFGSGSPASRPADRSGSDVPSPPSSAWITSWATASGTDDDELVIVRPRSASAASSSLLLIPMRLDSSCTRGLAGSPDRADSRVGVTETVPLRGPRARTGRVRTGTSYISFSVIPAGDRGKSGWLSGRSVPQPRRVRTRCLTHRGQQRACRDPPCPDPSPLHAAPNRFRVSHTAVEQAAGAARRRPAGVTATAADPGGGQ